MSVVRKAAKTSLVLVGLFVLLIVGGGVYLYMNMGDIAKQLSEKYASQALGVAVKIGGMDINLEEKKVVVSDIRIANPKGYKKPYAIQVKEVVVAAESFSKDLLVFDRIEVDGTTVNLEVGKGGSNLGDLKNNTQKSTSSAQARTSAASEAEQKEQGIKVIINRLSLTKAQLNPSVTLLDKDLAYVTVPDIHLRDIGRKENGVLAGEAIAQVMNTVLQSFNSAANSAGFLEGLSLEALNQIGVSTTDVFKKNLKKNFDEDVNELKKGVEGLKNMFGR